MAAASARRDNAAPRVMRFLFRELTNIERALLKIPRGPPDRDRAFPAPRDEERTDSGHGACGEEKQRDRCLLALQGDT